MKKLLAYIAGGLACLGAGAVFYISAANIAPRALPSITPTNIGIGSQINSAIDILDSRLDKSGSKFQIETSGSLGADSSTTPPRDDDKTATIFFAGDIMLDRAVEAKIVNKGKNYSFAKIKDTVTAANYAIANLEGPITKINSAPDNDMRFSFDPALGPELAAAGFDAFSLANNHGLDQGSNGLADTKNNLTASNLGYFGNPVASDGPILRFTTGYVRFAVIGLHDLFKKIDPTLVEEQIKELKKDSDYIIVYPHWGDEYQHKANARQTMLAHAFIDAGADMVIGGHPHVIQGAETYKGKFIFYSLGNLIFDQYFSVDTQQGMALRLNVGSSGIISIDLLPYEIPQSQPSFVGGDKKTKMLGQIAAWSAPDLKAMIGAGVLEIKSTE